MAQRPDTSRADRAFEAFTGRQPKKLTVEKLDDGPVTGWEMGPLVGVAYEAVRDGQRDRYFHEFAKSSRPRLVAREDGRQLYIAGGRYRVTDRGVEDVNPLFVVNPSKRKAKNMAARKRSGRGPVVIVTRNPAKRRRRPMSALQRQYFGRNPTKRRRRRSNFLINPTRRHASGRTRRYRRNPSARAGSEKLMKLLVPAVGIGIGAIGSEILVAYLPLPPAAKTGTMLYVTKGAVGIAAGLAIWKLLKQPRLGKYVAAGAVAIAAHDAGKSLLLKTLPNVKFGEFVPRGGMGYMSPAQLAYAPNGGGLGGVGMFVANGNGNAADSGGGGGEFACTV